jgi:hypothetical protein
MPAATGKKGNPPHSVDWKDLGSIYAEGNPNTATQEDNILYKNLFTVYYPSSELTVKQTGISQDRKWNAAAAGVDDAWRWIGMENKQADPGLQLLVRLWIHATRMDQ